MKREKQMWFKDILILFLISILAGDFAFAQQKPIARDTTAIYKEIEAYSKRSKFTQFMYGLFFKPVASQKKKPRRKAYKKLIQKPYSTFEGKIIRNINIETLDPFGNSIGDSIVASPNFISRAGNKLHIKSQPMTIRNLLLIRQGQPFDSLLVKESERLVRTREYIRDVSFFVKETVKNSDSVDVFIRALDIWSIIPNGSVSGSGFTLDLTDKNFLGLGHQFQNIYSRNSNEKTNSYITNYVIPNIRNTYISTTLNYNILGNQRYNRSLSVDRPFFSPFAKWAGGIFLTQHFHQDSLRMSTMLFEQHPVKYNAQDFWGGIAMRVFKGNSEYDRTTKFISAVRFLRIRYLEQPTEAIDPLHKFADENFYLASFGISSRNFRQDRYIFKFGIPEDVSMGNVLNLTGGYQERNNHGRVYLGARISSGYYYSWGYLGSNYEFGTFFRDSKMEQGVLTVGVNYFSGLREIGKWKFRQFVKPQLTIGLNRMPYDTLTINEEYGLNGFNSLGLSGTRRILLTLQTQSYAPWNFIGFRFGPFITYSMGMLGDAASGFKNSRMYSQFGLGVLIKNESLVMNVFQISIAFYPSIPGLGSNILKANSFKTSDFGLRTFEIAKPGIATFQ